MKINELVEKLKIFQSAHKDWGNLEVVLETSQGVFDTFMVDDADMINGKLATMGNVSGELRNEQGKSQVVIRIISSKQLS